MEETEDALFGKLIGAFKNDPRKKREEQVLGMLAEMASSVAASPNFLAAGGFVRGYGVALGITVPEHVTTVAFPPGDLFPAYDDIWKKSDAVFKDLASILAWRQCLALFEDIDNMKAEESKEDLRQSLMHLCGNLYPASDRAARLMRRYSDLLTDQTEQHRLRETFLMPPEHPLFAIHFMIINECLDGPSLEMVPGGVEPRYTFGMSRFAMTTHNSAVEYFRNRGAEIVRSHLAQ